MKKELWERINNYIRIIIYGYASYYWLLKFYKIINIVHTYNTHTDKSYLNNNKKYF